MTFYMVVEKNDSVNTSDVSVYRELSVARDIFRKKVSEYWDNYFGKETKSGLFRGRPYTDGSGRTYTQCLNDYIFLAPRKEGLFSCELISIEEGDVFEF